MTNPSKVCQKLLLKVVQLKADLHYFQFVENYAILSDEIQTNQESLAIWRLLLALLRDVGRSELGEWLDNSLYHFLSLLSALGKIHQVLITAVAKSGNNWIID